MSGRQLEGRRILLVEDEYFQALDAKRWLERAGADVVGPTGFADEVLALLQSNAVDAAILDINLGQGPSYEVAGKLLSEGVPFMFLTGYDSSSLPEEMEDVPCLEKPASEGRIVEMVSRLVRLTGADLR